MSYCFIPFSVQPTAVRDFPTISSCKSSFTSSKNASITVTTYQAAVFRLNPYHATTSRNGRTVDMKASPNSSGSKSASKKGKQAKPSSSANNSNGKSKDLAPTSGNMKFKGPLNPTQYTEEDEKDEKDEKEQNEQREATKMDDVVKKVVLAATDDSEAIELIMEEDVESGKKESLEKTDLEKILKNSESRRDLRRARRQRGMVSNTEGASGGDEETEEEEEEAYKDGRLMGAEVDDPVKRLTKKFKIDRDQLMNLVAADPDFMFQSEVAKDDTYDMTAAIIGAGAPTKDGIYLLPYLQNGHMAALAVCLVCAFVYNPGFPLTSLPDEIRDLLQKGIMITYVINFALALSVFQEAKIRGQSVAFWFVKVFLLGGLALNELQTNIRVLPEYEPVSVSPRMEKKMKKRAVNAELAEMKADFGSVASSEDEPEEPTKAKKSKPRSDTFLP